MGVMATGRAEHVAGTPAPHLRGLVADYVGYRYAGFPPGVHAGLPSRHLTFIVALDRPIEVGDLRDPSVPREHFVALVGGLHTAPAAVHHDGSQHGVQVALTPQGARALFGMPAAEIVERTVPMEAALGRLTPELVDRLHAAGTWSRRFAVLDDVLTCALARSGPAMRAVAPEVTYAWRRLSASAGAVAIADLAVEVGWSRRHLAERFRREFGLPPKTLASVVRFEHARRLLTAGGADLPSRGRPSLGAVALAAGYADQAHMTRDWRRFAGASPTRWLAREQFPFVQDGDTGPGAD